MYVVHFVQVQVFLLLGRFVVVAGMFYVEVERLDLVTKCFHLLVIDSDSGRCSCA